MMRFFSKFAFLHRHLWQQGGPYRVAFLLGPAPLLGALLAFAGWRGFILLAPPVSKAPPWATLPAVTHPAAIYGPQTAHPDRPLPPLGPDGVPIGLKAGWDVTTTPITVTPTLDVHFGTTSSGPFQLSDLSVDMADVMAVGPQSSLYVAVGRGYLVIKQPGTYALSLRLERPAATEASCLTRLALGSQRIVSDISLKVWSTTARDFAPGSFTLEPGLYLVGWAFGCWRDQQVTGPGRMTVLLSQPDGSGLAPVSAGLIVK